MDFQDAWKAAKETKKPAAGGERQPLPKGRYTAKVDNVVVDLAEEKISWTFKVTEGDFANRLLWRNIPLTKEWGLKATMEDISTLGLDGSKVDSLEDIAGLVYPLLDKVLKIGVTQREYEGKIYNNAYINGLFNEAEKVSSAPSLDKDEELPF